MKQHGQTRIFVVLGLVLVILACAGGLALTVGRSSLAAPSVAPGKTLSITVTPGETVDQVTSDLAGQGAIKSQFWFGLFARFKGLGSQLHPGQFHVDTAMGASAVIAKLEGDADVATFRVTFPEGSTISKMGDIVAASGLNVTAADYVGLANHPSGVTAPFLTNLPAGAALEGVLFPDTYEIPVTATAKDVIQMQLDAFQAKAVPLLTSTSLSPYQTVIVASIVEREAKDAVDRPLVSGVIANRLKQGMRLQLDATVLYGINVVGRSPSAAELQQDTPYNTYLHAGLPPTPIANPGASALAGAADPAATPFLFYVSDCSGHNHYSVGTAEHDQQVVQYLSTPCGTS